MAETKNNSPAYERASGSGLHEGHRERMRNKFKTHGDKVFETHELMEMLLYHIVPYRDTNPTAWRIMKRFSTLDGVAAAARDEIFSVDGVGERTADFLFDVFKLLSDIDEEDLLFAGGEFLTKDEVGRFFIDYFDAARRRDGTEKYHVVAIMLDSDMRVLSVTEPYDIDAGSGAVKSRPFIEAAVASHANAVILAHNHPFSSDIPSHSDMVTNSMIAKELEAVGIKLIEHYVISGSDYGTVIGEPVNLRLTQNNSLIRTNDGAVCLYSEQIDPLIEKKTEILNGLLSLIQNKEKAITTADMLSHRFTRLRDLFSSEMYVLKKLLGSEGTAMFLKLFFSIYIRRKSERFVFGRTHTEKEIAEYFVSIMGYEPIEKVYIMLFDSRGRPTYCEFVDEGTVDTSNLPPRRLVEIAKRHEASAAVLAHNHPSSGVAPSESDMKATDSIRRIFESSGVKFLGHYIVSYNDFCIIDIDGKRYKRGI